MFGTRPLRYASPTGIEAEQPPVYPCMLSQSFGVSHMKLGADPELRSLIKVQSVAEQPLGLARTTWEHLAGLLVMSVKNTNGLCSGVYG